MSVILPVLWDPGIIAVDDYPDGGARWAVGCQQFAWDRERLYLVGEGRAVPLARISVRSGAVWIAVGFVAGRNLPVSSVERLGIGESGGGKDTSAAKE